MAYRNKTYVAFHYGEKGNFKSGDKHFYHLMTAWAEKDDFEFYDAHDINNIMASSNNETIKRNLSERLNNTKVMIFLMGFESKKRPWVIWELESAIGREIPIIVVDVTRDSNEVNYTLLPDCLIPYKFANTFYEKDRIVSALRKWPERHQTTDLRHHVKY